KIAASKTIQTPTIHLDTIRQRLSSRRQRSAATTSAPAAAARNTKGAAARTRSRILPRMAWRFHENIVRGELDNTVRGRVTGRIWLSGIADAMTLDLRGDCAPDLAGCTLAFDNPKPVPFTGEPPALEQRGWVGDITASRK